MDKATINTYINGGLSGLVEITIIHPIEYFKTIKQNNNKLSFISFLKKFSNNGIHSLYKGYMPRVFGIIPMRTVFWGTMHVSDKYLYNKSINKKYIHFISGGLSGSIQTLIDCPIESLKTKMMTSNIKSTSINFNGFLPNLIRNVGFGAIFNYKKNNMKKKYNNKKIRFHDNLLIGSLSGILASLITQPFDYIKTIMQSNKENKSMIQIIKKTFNKNPMLFFSGTLPRTSITCISMGIGLSIFELLNKKSNKSK